MEVNTFHKEAMTMCLEAKSRGAFAKEYNAERDLWISDVEDIIQVGRDSIEKADLKHILDDLRFIASTSYFI